MGWIGDLSLMPGETTMFQGARKNRRAEQAEQLLQDDHEAAVRRVYARDEIPLAIARMRYYDSLTFRRDVLDKPIKVPDDCIMYGVIHEPYGDARRIHCEVKFVDSLPDDEMIGTCFLTQLSFDTEIDPKRRKLLLEISIWDGHGVWRRRAYDCLRDAAISQSQFCHYRINTTPTNADEALDQLVGRGYGPTINVREFTMWPTITLPKAPAWGFQEA
jgi:hypothetical protein